MTLTRQHFKLIANVLLEERDRSTVNPKASDRMAEAFAAALAPTNYRFNRERFLIACGYGVDPIEVHGFVAQEASTKREPHFMLITGVHL